MPDEASEISSKPAQDSANQEAEASAEDGGATVIELNTEGVSLIDDDAPEDSELTQLREQVASLSARLRTVSAAFQQQQDEVSAIRSRLERQAGIDAERRRGEVVGVLFEPAQNLRRSVDAMRKANVAPDFISGLDLVLHQFMESFHQLGLEEVPGKGARFNPSVHEAISMVPVTDPALDNAIIEVFSTGYRIGSRLITPARVVIGQLQESADDGSLLD